MNVAAALLKRGHIIDGRPVESVFRIGRRVMVAPHGWSYDIVDSVVVEAPSD